MGADASAASLSPATGLPGPAALTGERRLPLELVQRARLLFWCQPHRLQVDPLSRHPVLPHRDGAAHFHHLLFTLKVT